jgi:hypothetical protein
LAAHRTSAIWARPAGRGAAAGGAGCVLPLLGGAITTPPLSALAVAGASSASATIPGTAYLVLARPKLPPSGRALPFHSDRK